VNRHVQRYFQGSASSADTGHFHRVVALHETKESSWEQLSKEAPDLPRGWFELSRLSVEDRIEFVKGFWVSTLPYLPNAHQGIDRFFADLEDIGIYLTQRSYAEPLIAQMAYSLKAERGFFHGRPSAKSADLSALERLFSFCKLPPDYLAFLKIHDGFSKANDSGLFQANQLRPRYEEFVTLLKSRHALTLKGGEEIDPTHLIPFYESFGLGSYQCFYTDWYPQEEMGNLYYSGIEHSLSDYRAPLSAEEKQAFPTFLDWLAFYLESVPTE
jgi:hypothetical protein